MTHIATSAHRAAAGETLVQLAARFGLSSWRALAEAPDNRHLGALTATVELAAGLVVMVPPNARTLLVERERVVQRVRPALKQHFEANEALLARDVLSVDLPRDFAHPKSVDVLLGDLQALVARDLAAARQLAAPLAQTNAGLLKTHLGERLKLARMAHPDPLQAGIGWLLTPGLVELWRGMWDRAMWISRWRGTPRPAAMAAAGTYLNVVRSRVMQGVDERLRESLRLRSELDRET